MSAYATQMEAARKGIVTEQLKTVARKERMTAEELLPLVAEGKAVICANKNHKCLDPEGVGWRHRALPQKADRRVPGHDRHRAGVRFGHPLPARSG